jgi:hypothetical protein
MVKPWFPRGLKPERQQGAGQLSSFGTGARNTGFRDADQKEARSTLGGGGVAGFAFSEARPRSPSKFCAEDDKLTTPLLAGRES